MLEVRPSVAIRQRGTPLVRAAAVGSAGMAVPAGGVAGSSWGAPSRSCSVVSWAGVSVPPFGFSGPVTAVNRPLAASWLLAVTSAGKSFHAGCRSR